MKPYLILLLLSLNLLVGCQGTRYQPTGFTGGYSETQLSPDVFRVTFRGNGFTDADRAQDLALLRAAELTKQRGFTCFSILAEHNSVSETHSSTPGRAHTTATATDYGLGISTVTVNANTTYSPPQTHTTYKPSSGIMVQLFHIKPENIYTFDADFLQRSLKQKYRIP